MNKYVKAKEDETVFEIGDHVRCLINRKAFEKRSLAKWSKTVHIIKSKTSHSYTLENDEIYKYYELQPIYYTQNLNKPVVGKTREELRNETTSKRRFKKEGL